MNPQFHLIHLGQVKTQGNEIWLKDKLLIVVGITSEEQQIHQAKQIVGRNRKPK